MKHWLPSVTVVWILTGPEAWYERALNGAEDTFNQGHDSTLAVYDSIAKLYHRQGRLLEAQKMYTPILDKTDKDNKECDYYISQDTGKKAPRDTARLISSREYEQGIENAIVFSPGPVSSPACATDTLRMQTMVCLGDLFLVRHDLKSAIGMYSCAHGRFQITLGESSLEY